MGRWVCVCGGRSVVLGTKKREVCFEGREKSKGKKDCQTASTLEEQKRVTFPKKHNLRKTTTKLLSHKKKERD